MTTIFINGRVYAPAAGSDFVSALVVQGNLITHVGYSNDPEVLQAKASGGAVVDLQQHTIVPGFIDAHVHLLGFGLSLRKLDLHRHRKREDIRNAIREYAKANPDIPRLLCRGWVTGPETAQALSSWLDDLDERNRPIYLEAQDFHSSWINSKAIEEMDLHNTTNPSGGTIHRGDDGKPTGLLSEEASLLISSPFTISETPLEEKLLALQEAVSNYVSAGVTGVVDMAMEESTLEVLVEYRKRYGFPFHIAMHWLVEYSTDRQRSFAFVDRALQLQQEGYNSTDSPDFCIAGIKILSDGVIDSCTAALTKPYSNQSDPVPPIWAADTLDDVVQYADSKGLQIAIHAIGDQAVHQAINAIEKHGTPGRRHRIEHLELTSPEDAKRLGKLGITASVQPVHSDPVMSDTWSDIIGHDRHARTFAYKDFADGGALLAFGTETPTAPHLALPNVYMATTRRSTIDPESPLRNNPQFALPLAQAFAAATAGSAEARFAETWTGSLKKGFRADMIILDIQWEEEKILEGKVLETWSAGKRVFCLTNGSLTNGSLTNGSLTNGKA